MASLLRGEDLALLLRRALGGFIFIKTDDDIAVAAAAYIDDSGDVIIVPARIEDREARR